MLTHERLVKKMLKNPAVRAEYDAQEEEFALLDELLRARQRAGLTRHGIPGEVSGSPDQYGKDPGRPDPSAP